MSTEQDESAKRFEAMAKAIEQRSAWIWKVLEGYLGRNLKVRSAAALNCGQGEELAHLRRLVGQEARLHAVDIKTSPELHLMAGYSAARIHIHDIADVSQVLQLTEYPELIISRHPRVTESIAADNGDAEINPWWVSALTDYALRQDRTHGRMLISCFTKGEADIIAAGLKQARVSHRVSENRYAPPRLHRRFALDNGKWLDAAPDKWVITI
jgi:hypothetical protein